MINKVQYEHLDVKGKIQIDMYDATRKKVEEHKTTNFISSGMRNVLMKMAMASLFTQNKRTGGENIYDSILDPYQVMKLTDANHPESPDEEWFIRGNQVGYAYTDRTYSGDNEQQGTYNAKLSYTNMEQVHMVFDFPTHAANGTFESIYFTNVKGPIGGNFPYLKRPLPSNILYAKKYGNYIYVLYSGDELFKYDLDYNLIEEYNLSDYFLDFEIYDDVIYFAGDYSSRSVQKAPLASPNDLKVVATGYYAGGICFDEKNKQFVVSSSGMKIHRYNKNFDILSSTEIENLDDTIDSINLTYYEGDIFIHDSLLNKNDTRVNWMGVGFDIRGMIDDQIVVYTGELLPKVGISSRALLDSPVTKTDNVTMTITYDFILPKIY